MNLQLSGLTSRPQVLTPDTRVWPYIVDEVVRRDVYRLRGVRGVTAVLDIGANVGLFALWARELLPDVRIVAVEPHPANYACLLQNTEGLNIEAYQLALGPDTLLSCAAYVGGGVQSQFEQGLRPNSLVVSSFALGRLFDMLNLTAESTFIKMDCEGGESCLYADVEALSRLKQVPYFSVEIHVPTHLDFKHLPQNTVAENFFECFKSTHEVERGQISNHGTLMVYLSRRNCVTVTK